MGFLVTALAFCLLSVSQVVSAPINDPGPPNGTCLYDGLTMWDSADYTAYFVCCSSHWLLRHCAPGLVFDKYNLTCKSLYPWGSSDGVHQLLTDPMTGNSYTDTSCPDNSTTPTRPSPTTSQFCIPGTKLPNPIDPASWDECVDGTHYVTKYCKDGFLFNPNTKQCQQSPTTTPTPQYACDPGQMEPVDNGPSNVYWYCTGFGWVQRTCPAGKTFDRDLKVCLSLLTSPATKATSARPFIEGTCQESAGPDGFRPNPLDCLTYFQCVHSSWMLRDCGPGTQWKQSILGCDYYTGVC